jgi:hypothetical protein
LRLLGGEALIIADKEDQRGFVNSSMIVCVQFLYSVPSGL